MTRPQTLRQRHRLSRWQPPTPGDGLGAMLVGLVVGCAGIVVAIVVFA